MIRAAAVLALLAGPARAADLVVPHLADESATAGIDHAYLGEWDYMVGGGVAVFDCSGDGWPELFLAGGAAPAALFLNRSSRGGPLEFARAAASGLEMDAVTGAWPADLDGDGRTDLVVLRVGANRVMQGLGDCRFRDAGGDWGFDGGDAWSTAAAITWEPGATWPTVAVGNYIDRAEEAFPWGSCTDNWLHRPAALGRGFAPPLALTPSHCALSMLFTDWNRQGRPSLRVSNDREYYKGGQEQLWHLPPGDPPRLYSEAEGWARLRIWGMGIASHDITGDGYPDYFLTSMADNKLQVLADPASGRPAYDDVAFARGVTAHRPHTGGDLRPSTAWHAQFGDVNNDGRADLLVVKGNVSTMPDFAARDPNNLLLQRADGTFAEAAATAGVASLRTGRGGALADLNLDGMLDLVVVNRWQGAEIWRNTGPVAGGFAALRPFQPGPNRDAVGGWIELRQGDTVQRHEITLGGGHGGGALGFWHFGLPGPDPAEVRVLWPDGTAGDWQGLPGPGHWHLPRGGAPEPWDPGPAALGTGP